MRVLFVSLLLTLSCAKKAASPSPDRVVGIWRQGSAADFCHATTQAGFFYTEEQTITASDTYYRYETQHRIFADKACTQILISQSFQGTYTVGELLPAQADSTRTTYKMQHSRGNFKLKILSLDALNKANLMTAEGLQAGARLCAMTKDWVLNEERSITNQVCALGLETKSVDAALNILGLTLTEQNLVFGSDAFGNFVQYPLVLIEPGIKEWYKLANRYEKL